jgi:hypothetical protein
VDRPLPPGFREVARGVYLGPATKRGPSTYADLQIVVQDGTPPGEFHDCDQMGCPSAGDHVLLRTWVRGDGQPRGIEDWQQWAFGEVTRG